MDKWFVSGPFKPQAPNITIDLLVDKKSRFNNYHLEGLQLILVDETTGEKNYCRSLAILFRTFFVTGR